MKKFISALLVLILAFVLVGCAPKDVDAAKTKLEKKEYDIVAIVKDDTSAGKVTLTIAGGENCVGSITFTKKTEDGRESGEALLFNSAKAAKEYYENNKPENKDKDSSVKFVLSGKWVILATEQAVKDFR